MKLFSERSHLVFETGPRLRYPYGLCSLPGIFDNRVIHQDYGARRCQAGGSAKRARVGQRGLEPLFGLLLQQIRFSLEAPSIGQS